MRPDLVARYGEERLPRYTSYPTTPHFSTSVDASIYAAWLTSVPRKANASLYLHVPFCRRMCWYCGCHTSVAKQDDVIEAYTAAMCREIELISRQLRHRLSVGHVHFGGGTPTILSSAAFVGLITLLRRSFNVGSQAEIAVEIDPRTLDNAMIGALEECGVNRVSIGVQSFDPVVQRAINRVQSFTQTAAATEALRRAGVGGINFDLIYGLPHQTVASCIDTVLRCIDLQPDRFSIFGYAHVPGFKAHQRRIEQATLPKGDERYQQFEAMAATLCDMGYRRVGLDHFCLPGDAMRLAQSNGTLRRNFQGYTTDPSDILLGFGASAIGQLDQGYVQNQIGIRAYANLLTSGGLATVRGHVLTDDDRMRCEIIERIMCDFGADIERICERYRRTPDSVLGSSRRLEGLIAAGVATIRGANLQVADDARFLVRTVAAIFDAHFEGAGALHSRAV
jgi:oxygen-independent coproporphyrinogen III oxidase